MNSAQEGETPPAAEAKAEKNERITYLMDIYKLYHGHINTMFNYFLVIAGLIANAFIQALQRPGHMGWSLSAAVACFGVIISMLCLLIHLRSRDMIDVIEEGLGREERLLFPNGGGFLTIAPPRRGPLFRHKYQFPAMYLLVAVAFLLMALYSFSGLYHTESPGITL
jgi:hypothetical protein